MASAQSWEFEPYIELVATYTDNLYLGDEGNEISSWVGQVIPGFSLANDQGAFTTDTEYRMQALFFSDSSDLDTVFHQLRTASTWAVASDRFFVDLDASIEQAVVDPTATIPTSNVVATSNLGDVTVANINPYFIQPFGSSETYMRLDYLYGVARYDGFGLQTFSRVDDFDQEAYSFYLGTSRLDTGVEWSLSYDYQYIDYVNVTNYNFERAQAALSIPFGRSFRLVGLGGYESDLLVAQDTGGLDSDFWEAGFRINVGTTAEFEFRTGERFFGDTNFGSLQIDGRRVSVNVTYSENPTTSAEGMVGGLIIPFDPNAESENPDQPVPIDDIIVAPIRAEVYISKILRARMDINTGDSELYLSYVDEEREFLEEFDPLEGAQEGIVTAAIGYLRELGPRTTLEMVARYLRFEYTETEVETRVASFEIGVARRLGRELELVLSYRRARQETDSVAQIDNYVENAVDLSLVKRF